ncbi:hypothetical protein [Thermomonas carbonis]|uniref:Uncharacterized protein n=1 Tax=Thermomonas carbonis TaxID=1463158 RepID=A0A7G9SNI1_9GAMM|nr:hypothetical protein [Thermomonas carbonis]QNN69406.1 hypothetical protein H9L16_12075 [Thermomonas carbonis]
MQFFARPSIGRINLRSGLVLGALWIGVGIAGYQANGGRGEIRNLASAALFSLSGALIFALGLALIFSERFRDFLLEEPSQEDELVTASALISLFGFLWLAGGLMYVYRLAA